MSVSVFEGLNTNMVMKKRRKGELRLDHAQKCFYPKTTSSISGGHDRNCLKPVRADSIH